MSVVAKKGESEEVASVEKKPVRPVVVQFQHSKILRTPKCTASQQAMSLMPQ